MKTAVDYIVEMASELGYVPSEFYAKAKKLEKQQIIEAQVVARIASDLVKNNATKKVYKKWAEEYYNQIYTNAKK